MEVGSSLVKILIEVSQVNMCLVSTTFRWMRTIIVYFHSRVCTYRVILWYRNYLREAEGVLLMALIDSLCWNGNFRADEVRWEFRLVSSTHAGACNMATRSSIHHWPRRVFEAWSNKVIHLRIKTSSYLMWLVYVTERSALHNLALAVRCTSYGHISTFRRLL